jgi:hypothetical protein
VIVDTVAGASTGAVRAVAGVSLPAGCVLHAAPASTHAIVMIETRRMAAL